MNAKVLRGDHFSVEGCAVAAELRLISRSMKISGMVPRFTLQRLRAFGFTGAPSLGGYCGETPYQFVSALIGPTRCCRCEASSDRHRRAQPPVIFVKVMTELTIKKEHFVNAHRFTLSSYAAHGCISQISCCSESGFFAFTGDN